MVNVALSAVTLAVKGYALVDAAIRPAAAFDAVGKLPKVFWVLVLFLATGGQIGLALITTFAFTWLGIVGLAGIVVALVYLFGIRPEVIRYTPRRKGRGSSEGPYGPW